MFYFFYQMSHLCSMSITVFYTYYQLESTVKMVKEQTKKMLLDYGSFKCNCAQVCICYNCSVIGGFLS